MEYDAVVFDLDGVLVRGRQSPAHVNQRAAEDTAAAFDHADDEALIETLASPDSTDAVRAACRDRDLPADEVWRTREERASHHEHEHLRTGGRERYPDTDALLDLADRAALGVVSNNRHATVHFVCEHFEFGRPVRARYGRSPTLTGYDRMKPDTHYLDQALADLEPQAALYVGDRETDIHTAHSAGLDAAFLRREHNERVTPERRPEYTIEGLDDLLDLRC
jgi:HAD superfamily hydrolase (TIGR01549 family)